jgi:hypothetical protein
MNVMGGGNPNSLTNKKIAITQGDIKPCKDTNIALTIRFDSILCLFTLYISKETINLYRRVT